MKGVLSSLMSDNNKMKELAEAKSKQLETLERTNDSASNDNRQLVQEVREARAALRALEDLRRYI